VFPISSISYVIHSTSPSPIRPSRYRVFLCSPLVLASLSRLVLLFACTTCVPCVLLILLSRAPPLSLHHICTRKCLISITHHPHTPVFYISIFSLSPSLCLSPRSSPALPPAVVPMVPIRLAVSPRRSSKQPASSQSICTMLSCVCTPTQPSTWSASSPPPPFSYPFGAYGPHFAFTDLALRSPPVRGWSLAPVPYLLSSLDIYTAARLPSASCLFHLNTSSMSANGMALDFLSTYRPVARRHLHRHLPPTLPSTYPHLLLRATRHPSAVYAGHSTFDSTTSLPLLNAPMACSLGLFLAWLVANAGTWYTTNHVVYQSAARHPPLVSVKRRSVLISCIPL
jgi:hypothetical protein